MSEDELSGSSSSMSSGEAPAFFFPLHFFFFGAFFGGGAFRFAARAGRGAALGFNGTTAGFAWGFGGAATNLLV
jgi:hypothetical protein